MAEIFQQLKQFIPAVRGTPIVANIERILQPITDFIRGNPIVSTAIVGAGTTGLVSAVAAVRRAGKPRKKARKKAPKKRVARRPRKKTKAEIKACRLRNLAKARKARKKGKRRIIKGRGLGTHEIKHSGKSTKGKFKVVQFRDKRTGKMVRFKAKK